MIPSCFLPSDSKHNTSTVSLKRPMNDDQLHGCSTCNHGNAFHRLLSTAKVLKVLKILTLNCCSLHSPISMIFDRVVHLPTPVLAG